MTDIQYPATSAHGALDPGEACSGASPAHQGPSTSSPASAAPDELRDHAESLIRGIDALTRRFASLGPVPLDLIERYERILQAAHVANLQRVSRISERLLLEVPID